MPTVTFGSLKEGDKFRFNRCAGLYGKTLTKLKGASVVFNRNPACDELVGYYQKPDGSVRHMFDDTLVETPTPFKRKDWVPKRASEIPSGSIVRYPGSLVGNLYTLAKSASGLFVCLVSFSKVGITNSYPVGSDKEYLVEEEVLVTNEFEDGKDKV